jgi:hypothetical protein
MEDNRTSPQGFFSNLKSLLISKMGSPPLYVPKVELNFFEACYDHFKETDKGRCTERTNITNPFPQQTTRCIWCNIVGIEVKWQPDRKYTLSYNIYGPDGTLQSHRTEDKLQIPSQYCDLSYHVWRVYGYGWREPGNWRPGEYQAEALIDGARVATGHFTIAPPPPPKPPPPPAEVLQQPSVQFYASETGRFQTESRRNSIRFPQQSTRWVICELTARNLLYNQQDRTYHMTAQCYTAEGKQLWEDRRNWLITSQEQELSISWALQAGQWASIA